MAGIHDSEVIDLITRDKTTGEFAMIMTETRPWANSTAQLEELRAKLNTYAAFILDERLAKTYPESVGMAVRIQIDCTNAPSPQVSALVQRATDSLAPYGITVVVNVLS
jgi:hypothetical protein